MSLKPVDILPPVEHTKASIKALGACSNNPRVNMWWPDTDKDPVASVARELEKTKQFPAYSGRVCVVIGAGGGPLIRHLSPLFDRIYAFEPDFGLFGSLRRNIHLWGLKNVWFYKEAVGEFVGTVRMTPGELCGSWKVTADGPITVMQTTLEALELERIDSIIDFAKRER